MSYACSYEVPATIAMYREVCRHIGDAPADGRVAHIVVRTETGLRHLEVWESKTAWSRFHKNRVEPAVHQTLRAAGFSQMPPDPPIQELDLVDILLGSSTT